MKLESPWNLILIFVLGAPLTLPICVASPAIAALIFTLMVGAPRAVNCPGLLKIKLTKLPVKGRIIGRFVFVYMSHDYWVKLNSRRGAQKY